MTRVSARRITFFALGDVEAALRLGPPPQRDVGERDVVLEPRVGVVG